jgi:hypothetical protein
MSPGLVLNKEDCPELPDPINLKQKHYRSTPGGQTQFDISYPAAQLARLCVSAGPWHWAALTHLIGYLIHRPSLKIKYRFYYRKGADDGLDGFTDSDWGNSV